MMKNRAISTGLIIGLLLLVSGPKSNGLDDKEKPLALSEVKYWAYQIQSIGEPGAVAALADSHYDLLVLEPTRTDWSSDDKFFDTREMDDKLKNTYASDGKHRKLVVPYEERAESVNGDLKCFTP